MSLRQSHRTSVSSSVDGPRLGHVITWQGPKATKGNKDETEETCEVTDDDRWGLSQVREARIFYGVTHTPM